MDHANVIIGVSIDVLNIDACTGKYIGEPCDFSWVIPRDDSD